MFISAKNGVECDFQNGSYVASGDVAKIKSYNLASQYTAVVAPQTLVAGEALLNFSIDGEEYTWTPTEDITLESGYKYACKISFSDGEIVFEGDVDEWNSGSDITGGFITDGGEEPEGDKEQLSIDFVSSSAEDIVVDVNMNNYVGNYYVGLSSSNLYPGDAETLAEELIDYEKSLFTDFTIVDNTWVFNQSGEVSLKDGWRIIPNTEYHVVAFGIDAEGNITTEVAEVVCSSEDVVIEGRVDISLYKAGPDFIMVHAVPTPEIRTYSYLALETEDYENVYNSDAQLAASAAIVTLQDNDVDLATVDNSIVYGEDMYINVANAWVVKEETDYTILFFGLDASGNFVSSEISEVECATTAYEPTTPVDGSLAINLVSQTEESIVVDVVETGNVNTYYLTIYPTEDLEANFNNDVTALAEDIMDNELNYFNTDLTVVDFSYVFNASVYGYDFAANWENLFGYTDYTILAFGMTPNGVITTDIASLEARTEKPGTGEDQSDAYSQWIGSWSVTSASSENGTPVTFDVEVTERAVNESYNVLGWDLSEKRSSLSFKANFNSFDETMEIASNYEICLDESGWSYYMLLGMGYVSESVISPIAGDYVALTSKMNEDGTATTTCNEEKNITGVMICNSGMFGTTMIAYDPAYADGNDPIGPYTMVKNSSASAPRRDVKPVKVANENVNVSTNVNASSMSLVNGLHR